MNPSNVIRAALAWTFALHAEPLQPRHAHPRFRYTSMVVVVSTMLRLLRSRPILLWWFAKSLPDLIRLIGPMRILALFTLYAFTLIAGIISPLPVFVLSIVLLWLNRCIWLSLDEPLLYHRFSVHNVGRSDEPTPPSKCYLIIIAMMRARWKGLEHHRVGQLLKEDFIVVMSNTPDVFHVEFFDTDIRKHFREWDFSRMAGNPRTTSHTDATYKRDSADFALVRFIEKKLHRPIYCPDMSSADLKRSSKPSSKISGNRLAFMPKDLTRRPRKDDVPPDAVYKFVDSDYYHEDWDHVHNGHCSLIFGFHPQQVAGEVANSVYTIEHDVVNYHVTGGESYHHPVWDWLRSNIVFVREDDTATVTLVENQQLPDQRLITFVVPSARMPLWVMQLLYSIDETLHTRVKYATTPRPQAPDEPPRVITNTSLFMSEGKLWRSVGMAGEYVSATIRERDFSALRDVYTRSPKNCYSTMSTFLRASKLYKTDVDSICATYRKYFENTLCDEAQPRGFPVVSYSPDAPEIKDNSLAEREPTARALSHPIMDGGGAPDKGKLSDEACIKTRIDDVKNPDQPIPKVYNGFIHEFIGLSLGLDKGQTIAPRTKEEVAERMQQRPRTRAEYERRGDYLYCEVPLTRAEAFNKREAGLMGADPRNITKVSTAYKVEYGRFTLALAERLKTIHPWYAFGLTPDAVAVRVNAVACTATTVVYSDFSRFDGSHGEALCAAEAKLMRRAFGNEAAVLLRSQRDVRVKTSNGAAYKTGFTRLSGSPETSVMNTWSNALIAFITFRLMGYSPNRSMAALGIYGGDDGVTANIDPVLYGECSNAFGMKIDIQVHPPTDPVAFLGRIYPAASTPGGIANCCDILRNLPKLHISVAPKHIPREVCLRRKALGYLVTDPNTPIIGVWAKRVAHLTRNVDDKADDDWDRSWNSRQGPFANRPEDRDLFLSYAVPAFASRFGIVSEKDIADLESRIERANLDMDIDTFLPPMVKTGCNGYTTSVMRVPSTKGE